MFLYNTLSRKIESFKPLTPKKVGMYTCGPTVYGPGHLGHARSYTSFDLLKRTLTYNGFKVTHVLNITDVHDDMIKKANELKVTIFDLSKKYTALFLKDMEDLNVVPADYYPKVTEHIKEIIEMVKVLVKKGYGYVEKDGSVYFRVSKFADYGKLSLVKLEKAKAGTRAKTDKYDKEEMIDFALWKGAKEGEPSWESPWGKGRPGWHIECSVMSKKYLGDTFDIHGGGMDLKFPHHENEIAQSEAANGAPFVNYWFHTALLEVEGQKMAKSLGNFIEISQIKEKGFDPLALRYLFLTTHYRQKLNFTWEGLEAAQAALAGLRRQVTSYKEITQRKSSERSSSSDLKTPRGWQAGSRACEGEAMTPPRWRGSAYFSFQKKFLKAVNNDLAIPQALALAWEVVKSNISPGDKLDLLLEFDQIFGLKLAEVRAEKVEIPQKIKKLVEEREKLRQDKQWQESDKMRKKVEDLGFIIEDTPQGPIIKKK